MTTPELEQVVRAGFSGIDQFAQHILGRPLWPHQLDFALCTSRYRTICAGRQVGKSAATAVEALWQAFTVPGSLTLLVSAGDTASLRLLEECAALALTSPLLTGAVTDNSKHQLTLTNGSRIISVPASQRQIRGWAVDLLIIDEAGFVDNEIWRAAEPAIIARRGSRVILSSSPWGKLDHFFRRMWNAGMVQRDEHQASFHWPSSVSPLISQDDLDRIQAREAPHYFNREYLAEWTDESGAFFSTDEIENAIADYELIEPSASPGHFVVGGIDWGSVNDANAVVYLAAQSDGDLNRERHGTRPVFYVPYVEANYRMNYTAFIERLVDHARGFAVHRYVSELNGVGSFPTEHLGEQLSATPSAFDQYHLGDRIRRTEGGLRYRTWVSGVHTTNKRKSSGFGRIKGLLQAGRLVLPRHADLMRQLHSLTFEQTDSGEFKISVPENLGHDDLAMALMQAASSIYNDHDPYTENLGSGEGPVLTTPGGTMIHTRPRAIPDETLYFAHPKRV